MGIEIERKFLVHEDKLPELKGAKDIHQGYLCENPLVRIRTVECAQGYYGVLTIKGPGLKRRSEWEFKIKFDDALELMGLSQWDLWKRRRVYTDTFNQAWEIDEFLGDHRGLWLAEIELKAEDQNVTLPAWIDREVTQDPNFTNIALAKSTGKGPKRAETGVMQFGDDWPGVFIRGDNANAYSQALGRLLEAMGQDEDVEVTLPLLAYLEGLRKLLASSDIRSDASPQLMLDFGRCRAEP